MRGVLLVDTRHAMLYARGERTGVMVDVSARGIACLALSDGFLLQVRGRPCRGRSNTIRTTHARGVLLLRTRGGHSTRC